MKYRLKNKRILLLIMTFLIFIITMLININFKEIKTVKGNSERKYYKINIDLPKTNNKKINKKIINLINEEADFFIKETNEKKDYLVKNNIKSELNISYEMHEINNINTLIIKKKYKIEKDIYMYKLFTIQSINDQEIDIDFFFKSDINYLEILSKKTYYKLLEMKNEKKNTELMYENIFEKNIEPNKNNFNNFYFDNKGMHILLNIEDAINKENKIIDILIPTAEMLDYINYEKIYNKKLELANRPSLRDLEVLRDKKLIAFTFDDGPSKENTTRLLNELKLRNARASFFILGSRIMNQKDDVLRMYNEGHTIGNHTYNHINPNNLSEYELYNEIKKTNTLIENITKQKQILIRPPYGVTNNYLKKIIDSHIILWSVDTEDWKYKDSYKIKENIITNAKDGSIVLLHDIYKSSVDGALLAMDELKKQGYEFVSIEELLKLRKKENALIISNFY